MPPTATSAASGRGSRAPARCGTASTPTATWARSRQHTAAPVLVVGNLFDPATRYQGAQTVAEPPAELAAATVARWAHTSIGLSACADEATARYLIDGALPRRARSASRTSRRSPSRRGGTGRVVGPRRGGGVRAPRQRGRRSRAEADGRGARRAPRPQATCPSCPSAPRAPRRPRRAASARSSASRASSASASARSAASAALLGLAARFRRARARPRAGPRARR